MACQLLLEPRTATKRGSGRSRWCLGGARFGYGAVGWCIHREQETQPRRTESENLKSEKLLTVAALQSGNGMAPWVVGGSLGGLVGGF